VPLRVCLQASRKICLWAAGTWRPILIRLAELLWFLYGFDSVIDPAELQTKIAARPPQMALWPRHFIERLNQASYDLHIFQLLAGFVDAYSKPHFCGKYSLVLSWSTLLDLHSLI
jgi:hypothetical protein